jgi:uncharacterized protein GlcG (DUF336 family)
MFMSSTLKIFGGVASAMTLWLSANAQGLVSEKNISLAMARTIADGAMDRCKELGFKVSVVVVDRAGLPLVMLRGDGAGLHTPEGADRKAYTARTFRTSSADFVKRMLNDPASAGSKEYTRVLALSGGLPIKAGDDVVGAIGVSGSPGRDDECSQAGIDKVATQLQ